MSSHWWLAATSRSVGADSIQHWRTRQQYLMTSKAHECIFRVKYATFSRVKYLERDSCDYVCTADADDVGQGSRTWAGDTTEPLHIHSRCSNTPR